MSTTLRIPKSGWLGTNQLAAIVIAGLTSVGMIHSASKRQDANQQNDRVGTYKERLKRAKARGDKKIRAGGVIPLYAQVHLDQAVEIYDWVIGGHDHLEYFSMSWFDQSGQKVDTASGKKICSRPLTGSLTGISGCLYLSLGT